MKHCKVIAIINQKGGVGKTTTTLNLGAALAKQGKNVLLIDCDPQGNLTMAAGYPQPDELDNTLCDAMRDIVNGKGYAGREIIRSTDEGVHLIPANIMLASLEQQMVTAFSRESALKTLIESNGIKGRYDYIILDCQPSLGILSVNALTAADSIIIPSQPEYFSTKGLEQLMDSVFRVKRSLNPNLSIDGILITMARGRTNISRDFIDIVKNHYGKIIPMFNTVIPDLVAAKNANSMGMSVLRYDSNSKISKAYEELTKEVLLGAKREQRQKDSPEIDR